MTRSLRALDQVQALGLECHPGQREALSALANQEWMLSSLEAMGWVQGLAWECNRQQRTDPLAVPNWARRKVPWTASSRVGLALDQGQGLDRECHHHQRVGPLAMRQ